MVRVVIFVDDVLDFRNGRYFLNLLIAEWEQTGLEVLVCGDVNDLPEADIAVLHVDLTRIPLSYRVLSKRYPTVLNVNTTDISKRHVSRQLLKANDHYSGPVIVKTDANCGGGPERKIRYKAPLIGLFRRILDRQRHWTTTGIIKSCNYPIYQSIDKVPLEVWKNPALVVERFVAERYGENYALRQWVFFGNREISKISFSPSPIVKANNSISSERLDSVPDSLRSMREKLGFDYGKFDYVMHEGNAVLLDVNRTPTYARKLGAKGIEHASLLSKGIQFYLS